MLATMQDWVEVMQRVNDATYAAWNAHDAAAVAAVFAEDARVRDSSVADWEIGRAAVQARAQRLMDAFPDLRLERQALVINGPHHADGWILPGTHAGAAFGMAPTGNPIRIEGATFTTRNDQGEVIEDVHHVDYATLFRQLGVT